MGKSKPVPAFRVSPGESDTVTRRGGTVNPEFASAAVTRSRLSFTSPAGNPTIVQCGNPCATSTSTQTSDASIPRTDAERMAASMRPTVKLRRRRAAPNGCASDRRTAVPVRAASPFVLTSLALRGYPAAMRVALIIVALLLGLGVAVVAIGALLPRDHVATMTARIAAPPDAVWIAITTPSDFPRWRADVQRVELLPRTPTGPSWREHSKDGAMTMVVDIADPPRHLVTRIADEGLPFGGRWEYRIEPDGAGGSNVTITEHGSVYNPLFRFVSRYIMGHTATIESYLRALGKRFGSEPASVVVARALDALPERGAIWVVHRKGPTVSRTR